MPITFPWAILTIGIIVMIISLVIEHFSGERGVWKKPFTAPLSLPIGIFALAVCLSGLANGGIKEALLSVQGLRGMLVYFWAYWAFTLPSSSTSNATLRLLAETPLKTLSVCAILMGGTLAGLSAAIEQLTGYHPFSVPYLQGTGFLSGPMAFSGLAQLLSLLSLGILMKDGVKELPSLLKQKFVYLFIVISNCAGLLFCSERSAWLGAIAALLITSFIVSKRATLITGLSLSLIAVLSWLAVPVVKERLTALLDWQKDVSVSTRFILWQRALDVFKESPVFGIGIRHFPHLRIEEALRQGHAALDHAHSNYLHILATTGIVGICAYFYLWFCALKTAYTNQKMANFSKLEQGICLGIFAGMVSLAVSGLFEYNFGTGQVRLAQWFLLAMLVLPEFIQTESGVPSLIEDGDKII